MEQLLKTIYEKVVNGTDYQAYKDLKDSCGECMKTDTALATLYLKKLAKQIEVNISTLADIEEMRKMYALHKLIRQP